MRARGGEEGERRSASRGRGRGRTAKGGTHHGRERAQAKEDGALDAEQDVSPSEEVEEARDLDADELDEALGRRAVRVAGRRERRRVEVA